MKRGQHILLLTVIVQWTLLTRALSQTHWETAIYAEDTWHYFVGTTAPPANWKNLDFDENNWSSGLGGLAILMEMIIPPSQIHWLCFFANHFK